MGNKHDKYEKIRDYIEKHRNDYARMRKKNN